ncbi:acety-l/propionyl-CoA carboxylase subunit alpha [Streptomyces griseocarneus]|nr:acety-l/propionyl-CoA carboxylase subunit alpha [Streptomyces griseocarneus]
MRTVLVANRGEIACRVFRTCRAMGLDTVAVYAHADASALHVREADAAVRLPGNAAADTYLRAGLVIEAAVVAGADAVHPGYGFLSENAEFARAVLAAGLVWIGPPPSAIEAMASKTRAKELMAEAGVPLLAPLDTDTVSADEFPVLVKAAAGGGGRGMRVVRTPEELPGALKSARAEALAAFGDDEVFVEPYVEGGRHVEVQVLADAHGGVWALGTRDCSLQRRHQKVIEEAPAPFLPEKLRDELERGAVNAARAVGYVGAGTVEFLVGRDGRPYFLEMNTRLQVEHPVTERVYDIDLVALQVRVAEGLRLDGDSPRPSGHAVEARLYAEDPRRDWAPWAGEVHELSVEPGVRVDAGVAAGDTVTVHYDPLLAKVIAWAPTRAEATRRLAHALERARIHGPVTNRDLLVRSLRHPDFIEGRVDTGFYERHLGELTAPGDEGAFRLAALVAALADAMRPVRGAGNCATSPHRLADEGKRGPGAQPLVAAIGAWRNLPSAPQTKRYRPLPTGTGEDIEIRYRLTRAGLVAEGFPGVRVLDATPTHVTLETGRVRRTYDVAAYGDTVHVGPYALLALPRFPAPESRALPGSLLAPMPGVVARVAEDARVGAAVRQGQPLLWLEAMKMEHSVVSPADGTLTALHAEPGRQVEVGALLAVVIEEPTP